MSLHEMEHDRGQSNLKTMQNQPTSSHAPPISEEDLAEADEPPDERKREFSKTLPTTSKPKQSLLTQALRPSAESASVVDDNRHTPLPKLGLSLVTSGGTSSTTGPTSVDYPTSPETRSTSPSSSLQPANFNSHENKLLRPASSAGASGAEGAATRIAPAGSDIGPETKLEADLGRKRCIKFACTWKTSSKPPAEAASKEVAAATEAPSRRPCRLTFACPTRAFTQTILGRGGERRQRSPETTRDHAEPSPQPQSRNHRGSDSTVKNDSPKNDVKDPPARVRKFSSNSSIGKPEALRFHEFATDEEEPEDWMQMSTCYRSRLTIADTLRKENDIRRLAEEAEEEALDEEEASKQRSSGDHSEEEETRSNEDSADEDEAEEVRDDEISDAGFQSDDEHGFGGSDDDTEADSDDNWWAPGRSTAATSTDGLDQLRAAAENDLTGTSLSSQGSRPVSPHPIPYSKFRSNKRPRGEKFRPRTPDLPDSTDFVCGTLDEDKPLERAYAACIAQRRAAKGIPQDIDPSFPTSDPDMDEEDDEDLVDDCADEAEHVLMHGELDHDDSPPFRRRRAAHAVESSGHSPRRLRSPPPPRARGRAHASPPPLSGRITGHHSPPLPVKLSTMHRSPPPPKRHGPRRSTPPSKSGQPLLPGRLFGHSPNRQHWSQQDHLLRSPPPSADESKSASPRTGAIAIDRTPLARRPSGIFTTSLPRATNPFSRTVRRNGRLGTSEEEEDTPRQALSRKAIDIVYGLEAKRKGRQEKHYQKCRKSGKDKQRKPQPGKGAQRMREVGLEAYA